MESLNHTRNEGCAPFLAAKELSRKPFSDPSLPEAEPRLLKAQLVMKIQQLIEQKGVTQAEVAPLLGLGQPRVSNLMRGRLAGFSVERLFGILNRLGHNVEVRISEDKHEPDDTYTAVVA